MKHSFSVSEEQDMPLAVAVGAFLDCEHYVFLHKNVMSKTKVLSVQGRKVETQQTLRLGFFRIGHRFILEYFPPGHFRTHSIKPDPGWIPSIHHLVKTVIDVRYSKHPERDTTIMKFSVELDLPFWLYPFRGVLQTQLERVHWLKDQEDIRMIQRRAKLFGRSNISYYLAPGQFLMHKDDYIAHFGNSLGETIDAATMDNRGPESWSAL